MEVPELLGVLLFSPLASSCNFVPADHRLLNQSNSSGPLRHSCAPWHKSSLHTSQRARNLAGAGQDSGGRGKAEGEPAAATPQPRTGVCACVRLWEERLGKGRGASSPAPRQTPAQQPASGGTARGRAGRASPERLPHPPTRALSPSLSCLAQGPPRQGEPPAAAISCSPHGGEWPPRRGGVGWGARLPRCPVSVTACKAPAGGRAPWVPSSSHTLRCSLLRRQDPRSPCGCSPSGSGRPKSQSGAEARTPRTLRTR